MWMLPLYRHVNQKSDYDYYIYDEQVQCKGYKNENERMISMILTELKHCRLSSVPIFPICTYFFRFPIFFLHFNPISYIFYQIPIFFKMLQIKCINVQNRALFSKTVNL